MFTFEITKIYKKYYINIDDNSIFKFQNVTKLISNKYIDNKLHI